MTTREEVKSLLAVEIAEARRLGLWLHCAYQDIWMSPDDLERENASGRYLWGPVNWTLRHPRERLEALMLAAKAADDTYKAFAKKLRML